MDGSAYGEVCMYVHVGVVFECLLCGVDVCASVYKRVCV